MCRQWCWLVYLTESLLHHSSVSPWCGCPLRYAALKAPTVAATLYLLNITHLSLPVSMLNSIQWSWETGVLKSCWHDRRESKTNMHTVTMWWIHIFVSWLMKVGTVLHKTSPHCANTSGGLSKFGVCLHARERVRACVCETRVFHWLYFSWSFRQTPGKQNHATCYFVTAGHLSSSTT